MPHTIVLLLENREKKRNTCKRRTDKQGKCVRHWNPDTHGGLQGATWQLPQTMRIIILKLCSKFLFDISIFPLSLNSDSFFCSKKKNKNKKFGRISMRGPACTKETGDIYLLLQPTSSVYTGGTLVCLGIPGSKQYHCIRHALCCFSFVSFNMLSPLLYNFL